jgi:hypothetical protein
VDRNNHYEAAFEAYLRHHRLTTVAVDESRRSTLDDESIKSIDFIVYGSAESRLLIDVKGRKFPVGSGRRNRFEWQSWSPREDVDGLLRWEQRFGYGYRAVLLFMYQLLPMVELPLGTRDLWTFRNKRYLLRGVEVHDYQRLMRVRSPRWNTVHLPLPAFRKVVRPFSEFLQAKLIRV